MAVELGQYTSKMNGFHFVLNFNSLVLDTVNFSKVPDTVLILLYTCLQNLESKKKQLKGFHEFRELN